MNNNVITHAVRVFVEQCFVMEPCLNEKAQSALAAFSRQMQVAGELGLDAVQGVAIADLPRAALFDFYENKPGLLACQPQKVVQWFGHFIEVHQPRMLSDIALEERLSFARETGFLLVGPDEEIAIYLNADNNPLFASKKLEMVECFGVSPEGLPRKIHGVYSHDVLRKPAPTSIAHLDLMQTKEALGERSARQLVIMANPAVYGPTLLERENKALQLLDQHQKVAPPARTKNGAIRVNGWVEDGSASKVSLRLRKEGGWLDYNTGEDAWYFGIWINPQRLMLETYTEGDTCTITCDSMEQFKAELKDLALFYGARRQPSGYSYADKAGTATFECLRFQPFYDGRNVVLKGEGDAPVYANDVWTAPLQAMLLVSDGALSELAVGQSLPLSDAHIMLDLYNPLAFESFAAEIERAGDGRLVLRVTFSDKVFTGQVNEPVAVEAQ